MEAQVRGNLGWLEVICGSRFRNESEELLRRLRQVQIACQGVRIRKSRVDAFFPDGPYPSARRAEDSLAGGHSAKESWDFMRRPFEPMPQLMSVAGYVRKALAPCVRCGNPARRMRRLIDSEG